MPNQRFMPTRDHIENPERLLKVIRDAFQQLYTVQDQLASTRAEMAKMNTDISTRFAQSASVLGGIRSGPGALVQLGVDQLATKQSNLIAVTNPTATDDSTKGYAPGSTWINTNTNDTFLCASASPGAAVWNQTN